MKRQFKSLRVRAVVSAVALASLSLSLAAAPVAAVSAPSFSVHFNAKVSGAPNPYHLQVYASDHGIPANLQMWLRRFASTGNHAEQSHEYDVANTDTVCVNNLSNCHISDNASLGTLGRISLNFSPSAPAKSHQDLCYTDPTVSQGLITERKGVLTGTFRLNTGTGYFGSIKNGGHHVHIPAAIAATARKYVSSGNNCPPGPPSPCAAGVGLLAGLSPGSDTFALAAQRSAEPKGTMQFTWQPATGSANVTIQHTIFAAVPKPAAKITSNNPSELEHLRANFNKLAPFVTNGDATFNATEDPTYQDKCHEFQRKGMLKTAMTIHFDGFGTVHWSGGEAFAAWSQSS